MANNTIEIIGKLSIGKESEKFKPYETTSFPSGWGKSRLLFNIQSAENRHMVTLEGMYKEDGTGTVFSFSKGKVDPVTNVKEKGESLQIKWKDRTKPEIIEQVAEFKKFVIDLEKPNRRYELEKALKKHEEGGLSEEDLKALGVEDADELPLLIADSKKKRKEFITEYDFTEFMAKMLKADKFKGRKFKVLGEKVFSEYNGKYYEKMVPQRIYLANDDDKETSTGQFTVFYNQNSLDTNDYDEETGSGKMYLNGFVRNYDGNRKKDIPCPIQLVIDCTKDDEKVKKFTRIMKSQFTVDDDSWKEFGVKVKLLDGSQKVAITEDMLTDFQKEMLELEVITMQDIEKEIGGDVYGDKVKETVIINIARGYTKGRKDTVYVDADFEIAPPVVDDQVEDTSTDVDDDELFGDLDDLDL